jgi:hypothetical protein
MQSYISQIAPNSPITGDMISQVAQATGADPTTLMAIMQKESTFGTSPVAQANNNYGGIMYVGQAGATQGTARPAAEGGYYAKYATPQAGLTAIGSLLAQENQSSNPGGQATALTGYAAPFSNSVKLTQNGSKYISQDVVDSGSINGVTSGLATQALTSQGIAVVPMQDAATLDNIKSTQANLANFQKAVAGVNPGSGLSRLITTVNGNVNVDQYFQNSPMAGAYDSWKTGALGLVNSIDQGSTQGSRLYNALQAAIPTSTDTVDTFNQKIANLNSIMDSNEKSILGNYYVSSPGSAAQSMGGTMIQ